LTVNDYLQLDYQIVLTPEYGAWTASIPDLPGCIAVGDSLDEALMLIQDAKASWITASIEKGLTVPFPSSR
jgi:antitoxin HicB